MQKTKSIVMAMLLITGAFIQGCHKSSSPTTGMLSGTITDVQSGSALSQAAVIVFDANNNSPAGATVHSDANGKYSVSLPAGNFYVKVYKQGYNAYPSSGISPVSFSITVAQTTTQDVSLVASTVTNIGMITGKVLTGSTSTGGVLVVAEGSNSAYSSISDKNGDYTIYNVVAGSYNVKGYIAGFNSTTPSATVTTGATTSSVNVSLTATAGASINCTVTNLAASNVDVDIELVHAITQETIPGLSGMSVSQSYTLTKVPDGNYVARASYQNDQRVMDPDRIFKFGQPTVSVSSGTATISANGATSSTLTFYVTGSVLLTSPTNDPSTTTPLLVTGTTPTFQWTAYSSTSDYVIEVTDVATGNVIWGGFNKSVSPATKNIVIPSSQTSIQYNSDGKASAALVSGKVYRWKIYASKNDVTSLTGWKLISASEDQLGLIKIK
jgi:hypothetical protein